MTSREAYIALNMMDDVGPVRARALREALGSVEAIFEASADDLAKAPRVGPALAGRIVEQRDALDPAAEEARARKHGARIVAFGEPAYPEALAGIHDPPLALYVRGELRPEDRHALAVVGTRRPSHYGVTLTDRLSYQLAKTGFAVVSGLARGIDTAAHEGALKGGGRTLAVLGSALDKLYPPENAKLADRIAGQGAVISEFALGREADRTTFPYRNRIVSGLSMGVLVVEAGLNSGALMTADQALDQNRTVFACPGRADQASAKGSNRLIKAGARLVEDIDDILAEFEFLIRPEQKTRAKALDDAHARVHLNDEEQRIVRALWEDPLDLDTLTRRAELSPAQAASLLIGLEIKRVVRMLPGRRAALAEDIRSLTDAGGV